MVESIVETYQYLYVFIPFPLDSTELCHFKQSRDWQRINQMFHEESIFSGRTLEYSFFEFEAEGSLGTKNAQSPCFKVHYYFHLLNQIKS